MTYFESHFFYNNNGDNMTVYLDLVIILNFGFDLLLLFAVSIILRRNPSFKRLLLGSLIGSFTIISMFIELNSLTLFLVKVLISIIMVLVTYGFRDIKYTLNNLFYLYTSSILLGGFLYFLNLEFSYKNEGLLFYYNGLSINVIILIFLSPIIIYAYIKQAKNLKNNYSNYYNIDIYLNNHEIINATAFLDTGNHLEDPYQKRPIILLNNNKLKLNYNIHKLLLVPYDSINTHGLLKCIIPEKIFIEGIGFRDNFLVGIANEEIKIDGVDCILSPKLMEGRKI